MNEVEHVLDRLSEWTYQQKMAYWLVVMSCQSERAVVEALRWMAVEFVRHGGHSEKVTKEQWRARWESLFTGFRSGLPLTWGEYNYHLKEFRGRKVRPERMLCLLERHPTDARLLKLGTSPPDLGSLAHSPGRPCREHNREAMHAALQRFLSSDPEDIPEFRAAWVALYLASNQ